jgi:hypothetical protein
VLGPVVIEEVTVDDLYCIAALLDGSARLRRVDAAHTEESGSDIATTVYTHESSPGTGVQNCKIKKTTEIIEIYVNMDLNFAKEFANLE